MSTHSSTISQHCFWQPPTTKVGSLVGVLGDGGLFTPYKPRDWLQPRPHQEWKFKLHPLQDLAKTVEFDITPHLPACPTSPLILECCESCTN